MRTVTRYLLREQMKVFCLSLGGFATVFLVVEAFERTSTVLVRHVPLYLEGLYLLYVLPVYVIQSLPFVLLLSAMVTLGIMGRRREIMAMKVHGLGNYSLLSPFLIIALGVAVTVFFGNEVLTPHALQKAEYIWSVRIKGEERKAAFKLEKIWYRGKDIIYNIRLLDREKGEMYGVTLLYVGEGMRLYRRIDAHRAKWNGREWVLSEVTVRNFRKSRPEIETFPQLSLSLPETPADFQKGVKPPEAMSYGELLRYVRKLRQEGYETTRYLVDLHAKVAFPFVGFVLVLLGVPLALWSNRRREGGVAIGIVLSMAVGFLYWASFALSVAIGHTGALPPFLAAWAPNLFFAAGGVLLLESIPY